MNSAKILCGFLLLIAAAIPACLVAQPGDAMKQADREFSQLSDAKGPERAFLTFLSSDVLLINPGEEIKTGHAAIRENFKGYPADAKLLWEPTEATYSKVGDLGYTIGTWTSTRKNPDGTIRSRTGRYLTVWLKQKKGNLLGVLDMGQPQPFSKDAFDTEPARTEVKHLRSGEGDFEISVGTFVANSKSTRVRGHYVSVWTKTHGDATEPAGDFYNAGPATANK